MQLTQVTGLLQGACHTFHHACQANCTGLYVQAEPSAVLARAKPCVSCSLDLQMLKLHCGDSFQKPQQKFARVCESSRALARSMHLLCEQGQDLTVTLDSLGITHQTLLCGLGLYYEAPACTAVWHTCSARSKCLMLS